MGQRFLTCRSRRTNCEPTRSALIPPPLNSIVSRSMALPSKSDAQERFRLQCERFDRLVSPYAGPVEFLLKSHLLIEEQLHDFLRTGLAYPDALADARLTFAQTLKLVHALTGELFPIELIQFIQKLNTLRNRVAHQAEPEGVDLQLIELDASVPSFCTSAPEILALPQGLPRLHGAIRFVFAFIAGLHRGYEIMREHEFSPPPRRSPAG